MRHRFAKMSYRATRQFFVTELFSIGAHYCIIGMLWVISELYIIDIINYNKDSNKDRH